MVDKFELMWEIGVEGDQFRVHHRYRFCEDRGCIPLTAKEAEEWISKHGGIIYKREHCVNIVG